MTAPLYRTTRETHSTYSVFHYQLNERMMKATKPRVYLLGTGGSISYVGLVRTDFINYSYKGELLTVDQMLARVPEVQEIAEVRAEQFRNVNSNDFGPADWLDLARRINTIFKDDEEAAGVAITHGTGTLEETAYFLNLTVKSRKPVVITGAMRPPTGISTDADLNLIDCIRVAAAPGAVGKGVLAVMNNEINAARDVVKTNTLRVQTMRASDLGFLGYADSDHQVVFYRSPTRTHTADTEFDVEGTTALPRVDIVMTYAGVDRCLVDALVAAGTQGIIIASVGSGGFTNGHMLALDDAVKKGVTVVVASQSGNGRVPLRQLFIDRNYVVSDNLSPKKARILLMLALSKTHDRSEIQRMMLTY
jgi:L-asparaginase